LASRKLWIRVANTLLLLPSLASGPSTISIWLCRRLVSSGLSLFFSLFQTISAPLSNRCRIVSRLLGPFPFFDDKSHQPNFRSPDLPVSTLVSNGIMDRDTGRTLKAADARFEADGDVLSDITNTSGSSTSPETTFGGKLSFPFIHFALPLTAFDNLGITRLIHSSTTDDGTTTTSQP
jgi:hypothetical protein